MFALLKMLPAKELLWSQVPAIMISLMIAESFYKFQSFTLECVAFLATWFLIDAVSTGLRRLFSKN